MKILLTLRPRIRFVLCLTGILAAISSLRAAPLSLLEGMSHRVEKALLTDDEKGVAIELAKCDAMLSEHPTSVGAAYYKAWILVHRAAVLPSTEREQKRTLYDAAVAVLDSVRNDANDPELNSLYASVIEQSLSVRSPIAAMTIGPMASGLHAQAAKAAPESPRVALHLGTSLFHRPAMVGGGTEKALSEFRRAELLFKAQPTTRGSEAWAPTWGRVEVYAWIGQAEAKLGNKSAARSAYEEALRLEPNYGWVRYVLLPELGSP